MTRSEIEALLARHREAFANRDAAALSDSHAPQGTFRSPAAGLVTGRDQIAEVYQYWLRAFPDLDFNWDAPLIDGDRVALFWTFRGTAAGPFFGDVKPGTKIEFRGAGEYVVSPDGIESVNHLFDFTGALVSAGVLKVKPTS